MEVIKRIAEKYVKIIVALAVAAGASLGIFGKAKYLPMERSRVDGRWYQQHAGEGDFFVGSVRIRRRADDLRSRLVCSMPACPQQATRKGRSRDSVSRPSRAGLSPFDASFFFLSLP